MERIFIKEWKPRFYVDQEGEDDILSRELTRSSYELSQENQGSLLKIWEGLRALLLINNS